MADEKRAVPTRPFSFAELVQAQLEVCRGQAGRQQTDVEALRRAFVALYGPIVLSRVGAHTACGVALTDLGAVSDSESPKSLGARFRRRVSRGRQFQWNRRRPVRLHLVFPALTSTNIKAVEFLSRCEKQAIYARRFLQWEDLRQCLTLLYWAADAVVGLTDGAAGSEPIAPDAATPAPEKKAPVTPDPASVQTVEPEVSGTRAAKMQATPPALESADPYDVVARLLAQADQYYQYFTQRAVRFQYFRGIGMGTAAIALLFVVLYVFRGAFHAPVALVWAILAGALGALTSVLSRATFGRIVLDRAQGGTWNTLLGAFRPLLGSLFGAAFFTLINAGFLPISVAGGGNQIALYASVGFLAGFSHRWAQDTLKAAEAKIPTASASQEDGMDQGGTSTPTALTGGGTPKV